MAITIRGLSTLIKTMRKLCLIIGKYRMTIRDSVPPANQAAYDSAMDAILVACAAIEAIDYLLDGIGSN